MHARNLAKENLGNTGCTSGVLGFAFKRMKQLGTVYLEPSRLETKHCRRCGGGGNRRTARQPLIFDSAQGHTSGGFFGYRSSSRRRCLLLRRSSRSILGNNDRILLPGEVGGGYLGANSPLMVSETGARREPQFLGVKKTRSG